MRKLFIFVLLFSSLLKAQTTTVTATVTFPDGNTFANGTVLATFTPPGGVIDQNLYLINGANFPYYVSGVFNGSGTFTLTLTDDHLVRPQGGRWMFTVCSVASTPCTNSFQDVFGASIDLSGLISADVHNISASAANVPVYFADSEVKTNSTGGLIYYNYVSAAYKCWNGSAWIDCKGASSVPGGNVNDVQTNHPLGTFNGNDLFTWDLTTLSLPNVTNSNAGSNYLDFNQASGAGDLTIDNPQGFFIILGGDRSHLNSGAVTLSSAAGPLSVDQAQLTAHGMGVNVVGQNVTDPAGNTISTASILIQGGSNFGPGTSNITAAWDIGHTSYVYGPSKIYGKLDFFSTITLPYIFSGPTQSTPSAPSAGIYDAYFKTGLGICTEDSAATELCLGAIPTSALLTKQGNGAKVQISTGSAIQGDVLQYDSNSNAIDSGILAAKLTGAFHNIDPGSTTVNANTTNDQNLKAFQVTAGVLNSNNKVLHIWSAGTYTTPVASTATLTFKLKLCSVSGCGSGTVLTLASWTTDANPGSVTTNPWNLDGYIITQTAGASAAFESHGHLNIDLGATPGLADKGYDDINTATVGTIDSTATTFLQLTVAYSAASASNSTTERQLIGDTIN